MKKFFKRWKQNFSNSWILALLVILAINALSLALENGMQELTDAMQRYGMTITVLLVIVSIIINTLLLTTFVSFVNTLIEPHRKKKIDK